MTSVALCTYNGERYIREQIESIINQTMPVDEIVVCDDGSTDDTIQIIEKLRSETDITLRVFKNEEKLGVGKNFQKAVDLCKGNIIFLSDQDDVWLPNKVETISSFFEKNNQIDVVFTDAELIDGTGQTVMLTPNNLWGYHFTKEYKKMFDSGMQLEPFIIGRNHATGATMAVRREFAAKHPFAAMCSHGEVLHDFALAIFAAEKNSLGCIEQKLTKYRIHSSQTCGIIINPFNVDYQIYVIDTSILPYLQNKKAIECTKFAKFRLRQTRRSFGLLSMISNVQKYKRCYGEHFGLILRYDFKSWIKTMWNRFPTRKKTLV